MACLLCTALSACGGGGSASAAGTGTNSVGSGSGSNTAGGSSTSNGSTSNGSASNGSSSNGSSSNGSTSNGSSSNGSTSNGSTSNGSTSNGSALDFLTGRVIVSAPEPASFGSTLVLVDGDQSVNITHAGTFEFPYSLPAGWVYNVTVQKQPAGLYCTVSNGTSTGTGNQSVGNLTVNCGLGSGSVMYSFGAQPGDGSQPQGLVSLGDGEFLGVTLSGGNGNGTYFSYNTTISPLGETQIHAFQGAPNDGAEPYYPPIAATLLPGIRIEITGSGGAYNDGAILYQNDGSNTPFVVASFNGTGTGSQPDSPLLPLNGTYYGLTYSGGLAQDGTLYVFNPANNTMISLQAFGGIYTNYEYPEGQLVLSKLNGNIYGAAEGDPATNYTTGGGVFMYEPGPQAFVTVCSFGNASGPVDPVGGLVQAANGTLYGVSSLGGGYGDGTIFEVFPSNNTCQVLYSFTGSSISGPGVAPVGPPFITQAGDLYVTTTKLGNHLSGAVDQFSPNGTLIATPYSFGAYGGSSGPSGGLVEGPNGYLYGTTQYGGAYSGGAIYQIN